MFVEVHENSFNSAIDEGFWSIDRSSLPLEDVTPLLELNGVKLIFVSGE